MSRRNVWCLKPLAVGSLLTQPEMIKTTGRISSLASVFRRGGKEAEGKAEAEAYGWGQAGRWLSRTQRRGSLGLARRAGGAAGGCGLGGAWDLDWPL